MTRCPPRAALGIGKAPHTQLALRAARQRYREEHTFKTPLVRSWWENLRHALS